MTKIALVDDHILLRDALAESLSKFDDCQVIVLAGHGGELLDALQLGNKPDLVILDINMPQMDGYATASYLKEHYPDIYVLALTMYDSEFVLIRLLQMGARGFLKKDVHPSELRQAIQMTVQTGYFYANNTAVKLVHLLKNMDSHVPLAESILLTDREILFLELSSTDLTYKEIAHQMKISFRTVDSLREGLFAKLSVKSRVGLAMYAIKSGIAVFP